jgi:TDG/mug DNA glycosylase family protein
VLDSLAVGEIVVPNEMARELGVTGLQLRNWLRSQKAAGHPLLGGHLYGQRWVFSRPEADQLMAEYRASTSRTQTRRRQWRRTTSNRSTGGKPRAEAGGAGDDPLAEHPLSADPGHRVATTWMSEDVVTLADLLRTGLQGVVVGINPSPVSVAAGHYYQGSLGKRFFAALAEAGVLPDGDGFEDDRAFAAGLGFTDLVKRPTARASGLPEDEFLHGSALLEDRLRGLGIPRMVFTFKKSATVLLGPFDGFGLIERDLFGAQVFVMSGPMARAAHRRAAISALRDWWRE